MSVSARVVQAAQWRCCRRSSAKRCTHYGCRFQYSLLDGSIAVSPLAPIGHFSSTPVMQRRTRISCKEHAAFIRGGLSMWLVSEPPCAFPNPSAANIRPESGTMSVGSIHVQKDGSNDTPNACHLPFSGDRTLLFHLSLESGCKSVNMGAIKMFTPWDLRPTIEITAFTLTSLSTLVVAIRYVQRT